jgi:hypothetical protein
MTETSTDLAAAIALRHQRVHRTVMAKIQELNDGGLSAHEIASHLGIPLPLVNLVLRGAPPGVTKR